MLNDSRTRYIVLPVLLSGLAMVGAGPLAGQSRPDERTVLARELVAITFDSATVARSTAGIVAASVPAGASDEQREQIRRRALEAMPSISRYQAAAAEVYAELYTARELRELLAFYRSPVGRKSVRVGPEANQRILRRLQRPGGD